MLLIEKLEDPATPGVVQDSHNYVHDVVYVEPGCYSLQQLPARH